MNNDYSILDVSSAINECQFAEFKTTVESGALDVNMKDDESGLTALKLVLSNANKKLDVAQKIKWIKLLASLGADLNDESGSALLRTVMNNEDTEIIKCLVEQGANLHEKFNNNGLSLLHIAAQLGNIESIKCLVSLGIDVNERNNNFGYTPICCAIEGGQIGSVQCLAKLGADVNARINGGYTPIFLATAANNVEGLKCLKALGADFNAKTDDGRTALSVGIKVGDAPEAVEWLKNNGVK